LFTVIAITRRKLICVSKIAVGLINLRIVTNEQIMTSTKGWSITRATVDCILFQTLLDVGNKWRKVVLVA
jgi:hypothetical protein